MVYQNIIVCVVTKIIKKYDETLNERFVNTYRFSNLDKNKFILLLRKGVYPYEYKNDWETFNETLPLKYGTY